jgi:hypothetical protein
VPLGVSAPKLAGELVEALARAGVGYGVAELFSKHRSPFPKTRRARDGSGNTAPFPLNEGVDRVRIFGEDQRCSDV